MTEDGLFASYSEVIQRVGSDALRIYLYHIPARFPDPAVAWADRPARQLSPRTPWWV